MKHMCSNIYRHHCTILRQVLQLVGQLWHDSWLTGRILVHGPIKNMVDELINFRGFEATNEKTHKLIVHIVIPDKLFGPTRMQLIECLYSPVESKACIHNCINKFPLHDWSLSARGNPPSLLPWLYHSFLWVFHCIFYYIIHPILMYFYLFWSWNVTLHICNCMIIILQRMR